MRALRDPSMRESRQRLDDQWREQIAAVIADGQGSGDFGGPSPERAALELAALIDGLAVQVALGDRLVTPELMRSTCIEVAERLLEVELARRGGGARVSRLSRRELLQTGAGLALAGYGLAGCTVERQVDRSAEGRIIKPEVDGDLLIYNWAQYMDPALKQEFCGEVRGRGQRGQLRQPRGDGDQAPQRRAATT